MLDSVINLLNQYLDEPIAPFDIKQLTISQIDVVEYLYLCKTKEAAYLVFETDFVFSLPRTVQDAEGVFANIIPTAWMVKRTHQKQYGKVLPLTTDTEKDPKVYEALISNKAQLRQAVMSTKISV